MASTSGRGRPRARTAFARRPTALVNALRRLDVRTSAASGAGAPPPFEGLFLLTTIAALQADVPQGVSRFDVPGDPAGFARELYRLLREIDARGFEVIVAMLPPEHGLGLAVRDCLRRAAAPKDDSVDGS